MKTSRPFGFRMTLGMTDFITAVMFIAGVIILVSGSIRPQLAIVPSTNTTLDIALLLAMPAVLAVIIGLASSADRRCADDFAHQLLATSAMIGMFTMIGVSALWAIDFIVEAIGTRGLRGPDMMAIGQIGWGASYLAFRIRGGVL